MFPLYQSSQRKDIIYTLTRTFPLFPFILVYLVIPLLFYQMLVELILLILEWFACLFYSWASVGSAKLTVAMTFPTLFFTRTTIDTTPS